MEKRPELVELGKRIKELRLSKGITQLELGARIGKDSTSITRIESGRINPSFLYLLEISKGLECHISEIIIRTT